MEYKMWEKIFIPVASSVILALILWFIGGGRAWWDRRKVYQWLKANTNDKPGDTHVDTVTIVKGTCLPEDRTHKACMSCSKIYCYTSHNKTQWSIWREEPQSIHTGKSVEEILKEISL